MLNTYKSLRPTCGHLFCLRGLDFFSLDAEVNPLGAGVEHDERAIERPLLDDGLLACGTGERGGRLCHWTCASESGFKSGFAVACCAFHSA